MFNKAFKITVCLGFILVLMTKVCIPVTAVFIGHFSKQNKPVILLADQEKDDEKSSDSKDDISKTKKSMDEVYVHFDAFSPVVAQVNLLYHQQEALFKQTHFPAVVTPPPDLV